jgi:hypothetical protein
MSAGVGLLREREREGQMETYLQLWRHRAGCSLNKNAHPVTPAIVINLAISLPIALP